MKPYITCFMMSSVDGRIDCAMTEHLEGGNEYYQILSNYNFDATLSGKVTAIMHLAKDKDFKSKDNTSVNERQIYKAESSNFYSIVVDTIGTLTWESNIVDNGKLIVILSEQVTKDYLAYLKEMNISYIVTGKNHIDLVDATSVLNEVFNIKRLGIVGGGNINGAFLDNHLLDEVSVLVGPGVDGREGMTSTFDGIKMDRTPFKLNLKNVTKYDDGAILLEYSVINK